LRNTKLYYFIVVALLMTAVHVRTCAQATNDTTGSVIDSTRAEVKPMPPILNDSSNTANDSIKLATEDSSKKHKVFQPNPKRSGLYSAIFPGLGQLYNRQYWKIPVVYGVLGVAGYFLVSNQSKYQEYRKAYIGRLSGDLRNETDNTRFYDTSQLKILQDGYKRFFDITVLLTGVGYTLQIIDAVVFAHLKNFDVSRDISMRMRPLAMPNGDAGIGLVFNIKPKRSIISNELYRPF